MTKYLLKYRLKRLALVMSLKALERTLERIREINGTGN